MNLRLDPRSGVPIYVQIVNQIKYMVASGQLEPGAQLPTIRQLAVNLTIDPNTVARAYMELDREGIISTQQGRGTFVSGREKHADLAELRRQRLGAIVRSAISEALGLGFSAQEMMAAIEEELKESQQKQ
ncbi:MAG: GntR family transcriptional regulator [Chloroflexota bacterium]